MADTNLDEIFALITELEQMIGDCPCTNKNALNHFRKVGNLLDANSNSNANTRENVLRLIEGAECWFSADKWKKYNLSQEEFKVVHLLTPISGLKKAFKRSYLY